jgi:hypothetical protein
MSSLLYPAYAIACAALLARGTLLLVRRPRASTAIILLVTFGVFYDNLVLAIGALAGDAIGPGDALLALSVPRFVLHQLVLPWLVYAAWDMGRQAGHAWAAARWARPLAITLSVAVMAGGIATRLVGLQLEPEVADGVLRYVAVGTAGPPIVSIVSIGFAGLAGLVFWRRDRWPWIVVAAVAVFIAEAFPDEAVRRAIGSAFEIVFLAVLLVTQLRLDTGRLARAVRLGREVPASA